VRISIAVLASLIIAGCAAPSGRLTFPARPIERSSRGWFYDVHHRGHPDFALLTDGEGRIAKIAYDDGNGRFNRIYQLSDYANGEVPHLIVMLDSIPYQAMADRYAAGDFRWFDPPQKVIPPFPSLTEICYSTLLGAPPLPGFVDDFYDPDTGRSSDMLFQRLLASYREPWERRLHYDATVYQSGLAYLHPREWYAAELQLAKQAFDESPDRVTLVYLGSASSMLSKYGRAGLEEVLDGIQRMCIQILYERQGAVKISMMADHGHNLTATKNISLEPCLAAAGFHVTQQLLKRNDVVIELHGLVTYTGVRTMRPAAVAKALCGCPEVNLASYLDGEQLIVRNAKGSAAIECRDRKLRYLPIDEDVLNYAPVISKMRSQSKVDPDGYVADNDWFFATLDHEYPDAPRRLWEAFHGTVTHPPEVAITIRDGFCAGRPAFEAFIKMASTHGSLNQVNSATFVMSMTGRVKGPLRTRDVFRMIEPGFVPQVR